MIRAGLGLFGKTARDVTLMAASVLSPTAIATTYSNIKKTGSTEKKNGNDVISEIKAPIFRR